MSPHVVNRYKGLVFIFILYGHWLFSQTGPGGVGNTSGSSALKVWVSADKAITVASGRISQWSDQSGSGNHFVMATAANQPSFASNVFNGFPAVRFIGTSAYYFNSAFTGPNSSGITIFLFAKGTSYQSIVRYQNQGSIFLVYPWEVGGGRTFITSSDGSTGGGIASGLANGVKNIGTARYNQNTATSGFQTFLNGGLVSQRGSVNSVLPNEPFFSGRYNPGASEYPTADVPEIIIYYSAINEAQRIIVENYLAAKYDTLLASNDVYTMDDAANGHYDFDVAGIGEAADGSQHTDARGTGIVEISGASSLSTSRFFIWGKNNIPLGVTTTADMPSGAPQNIQTRWGAEWRASESGGDVGTMNLSFDLTGFTPATANDLRLLIDTDNDGFFSDEVNGTGVLGPPTALAGNVYRFSGVNIADGRRFTLGSVNSAATTLPIGLIDFSASEENQQVVLRWQTSTEASNKKFEIYRSADAMGWDLVGTVNGHNNSAEKNSYILLDAHAASGTNYYKLEDVDNYGNRHTSKILAMDVNGPAGAIRVYPNPSNGKIFIDSGEKINSFDISLFDWFGKKQELSVVKRNDNSLELQAGQLVQGFYLLNYHLNNNQPGSLKININGRQ